MTGDIVRSDALTPTLSHGEREEIRSGFPEGRKLVQRQHHPVIPCFKPFR